MTEPRQPAKRTGKMAKRSATPDTSYGGGTNERAFQGQVNPDPGANAPLHTRSGGPRNRVLDKAAFLSASRGRIR